MKADKLLCVITILFVPLMAQATQPDWLVQLHTPNDGFCSGVSIGGGYVVTAEHCQCGTGTYAELKDGSRVRLKQIFDPVKNSIDEVTLLVSESQGIPSVKIATQPANPGDRVTSHGFPGIGYAGGSGNVHSFEDGFLITRNVENVVPGMSGGALLNDKGELIALCSGYGTQSDAGTQKWINLPAIRAAVDHVSTVAHPMSRRLVMFSKPGCSACEQFKAEAIRTGQELTVVSTSNRHFKEWRVKYKKYTGKELDTYPTFWIEGTKHTRTEGYRPGLLTAIFQWFGGAMKALAVGLFGERIEAPPPPVEKYERSPEPSPDPLPAPVPPQAGQAPAIPPGISLSPEAMKIIGDKLDPPPAPKDPDPDVDWNGVILVVAASSDVSKVSAVAEGPGKRALQRLTDGKAILRIVSQRTNPEQFAEYERQVGVTVDKFHVTVLISKRDVAFPVAFAIQQVELRLNAAASNLLSDRIKDIPVEPILERIQGDEYQAMLDLSFQADSTRPDGPTSISGIILSLLGLIAGPFALKGIESRLEGWKLRKIHKKVTEGGVE